MDFFFSAVSPCVYLDQRPGCSRTVADLCLPEWVQASCCFISPRVLWHLSLFTCSVMVIPSDRVSSLSSFSVFLSVLFSPLPPHCFHLTSHHPNTHPPICPPAPLFPRLSASPRPPHIHQRWCMCIRTLATVTTAQSKLNLVRWGTLKREMLSVRDVWRETAQDGTVRVKKMKQPLRSFNYLNGRDWEEVCAATVALL